MRSSRAFVVLITQTYLLNDDILYNTSGAKSGYRFSYISDTVSRINQREFNCIRCKIYSLTGG
jgi:hypothetical protein